jgi:hypothetical protein
MLQKSLSTPFATLHVAPFELQAVPVSGLWLCYIITFWMVHTHSHDHHHGHAHSHGPATPHPAQAAPWSILRMTVVARLGAAVVVSGGLWTVVWLAMR